MNKKAAILFLVLALPGATLLWRQRATTRQHPAPPNAGNPRGEMPEPASSNPMSLLQQTRLKLQSNSNGPAASRRLLAELRARLKGMPKKELAELLRSALASGLDAPTGLELKPDGRGGLADAPSLRVFLLDQLRALDPATAQEFARSILQTPSTPDEWAISLALSATDNSPAGRDFVRRKARQMVLNEEWQRQPTSGFLEAFDLFVFTHDTGFAPELASFLAQTRNRALAHAAFLTLDRLVLDRPVETLAALALRPELLAGREAARAGYFARADVRDPAQRSLLEDYLLAETRSLAEWNHFAGTYPNANYMVSANLLTTPSTPGRSELAARDQAALDAVKTWLAEPRFARRTADLEVIRTRLEKFVHAEP